MPFVPDKSDSVSRFKPDVPRETERAATGIYPSVGKRTEPTEDSTGGFVTGNINIGIAQLLGLPVDTAENLVNLARAGIGTATQRPQDWPLIEGSLGGSQSIQRGMERMGAVGPSAQPESAAGRYAAAALRAAPAAMIGRPSAGAMARAPAGPGMLPALQTESANLATAGKEMVRRLPAVVASGVGAQAATDIAGPEYAPIGAMIPGILGAGIRQPPGATERAARERQAERFGKAREMGIPVPPRELHIDKAALKSEEQATQALGFPAGTELSPKNLQNFRNAQWDDYKAVIDSPALKGGMRPTPKFQSTIQDIGNEIEKARANLPETFKTMRPVLKLLGEYGYGAVPSGLKGAIKMPPRAKPIPSDIAMRAVKKLRADAGVNFQSDNPEKVELAHVQRKIAGAIEDLIGEQLSAAGDAELMSKFQSARTNIAKSHDIESALDPRTRKLVPAKLSQLLTEGKPLTGGLRDIAEVAGEFPGAMKTKQEPEYFTQRVSPMAVMHPEAMSAHWLTRLTDPLTTSRPYQSLIADPRMRLTPEENLRLRLLMAGQAANQSIRQPPEGVEGRADGGPVSAGRPYVVGERGPELIVPQSDGQVVPNQQMAAADPYYYTKMRNALPPTDPRQAQIAPIEHGQFTEETVRQNPWMAIPLAMATPAYTAGKALGLIKSRSPASIDEMLQAYYGIGRGLRSLAQ